MASKAQIAADIERIGAIVWDKLQQRFPMGCRVRISALGHRRLLGKRYSTKTGTVVGYYAKVSPNILWDGYKTPQSYAQEFLTRVRT